MVEHLARLPQRTERFANLYLGSKSKLTFHCTHHHILLLLLNILVNIIRKPTTIFLQIIHTVSHDAQLLGSFIQLPLRPFTPSFLLIPTHIGSRLIDSSALITTPLHFFYTLALQLRFRRWSIWPTNEYVKISRCDVLGPGNPLKIGDGRARRDKSIRIEEFVVGYGSSNISISFRLRSKPQAKKHTRSVQRPRR